MNPGTIVMPLASNVCVDLPARPRMSAVRPTATNLPSFTANASARGLAASIVYTFALVTMRSGSGAAAPEPDLIVTNAKVYTMDAANPRAEAFAVKDGKFVAVGRTADIRGLAGKSTQTFDAKGMTIVPGFIDTHNHAGGTTLLY